MSANNSPVTPTASNSWHISFSSLQPYAPWIDQQWPEASEQEKHAWSGFCGHIEHLQRFKQPINVPVDKLSAKQLENAISDIVARGWAFELEGNRVSIFPPHSKPL